jgi:hypothetical protein
VAEPEFRAFAVLTDEILILSGNLLSCELENFYVW